MRKKPSFARSGGTPAPTHNRPARTGIRPALFYGMFALLLTGNALTATALLLTPDIARLFSGQTDELIDAYEDRLAQLRVEVDRLHSRSYAQAGDINLQLQELSQQQEVLLEQHQLVRLLVDKADQLGIETAALAPPAGEFTIAAPLTASGNPDVDATAVAIAQMMGETQFAMSAISEAAISRTDSIVAELSNIGIRIALPEGELAGMGGPLLPAAGVMTGTGMIDDANAVMTALVRYQAARESIESAPVHMPISGNFRQSSGFGNRKDPFSGGRAFHSGLDFAAPSGSIVYSAATGIVTFVGTRSGYGNVVEVTHSSGLVSRYAHLSGFLSKEGQAVTTGTPIAKVGSTGRSTGPHLHFEVRKGDAPLDPIKYLNAGKRLLGLMG
ncbi:M23 family metallopeptidase [Devosia limi]|uniref:Peptidase family M23 n=1 Tax=Devosia limi DSM 17137 TaxID=1121477 RepID=A0A1M4VZT0_9HYPH|nr:M23 family metallopeptidase [Devosia limi]SHE74544.1 Peptidase family M23 [Devosia limi DSM 17137]